MANNNVRMYRARDKKTQAEVAANLNIAEITYRNKENGITDFTITEGVKLAELFQVTLDKLFNN